MTGTTVQWLIDEGTIDASRGVTANALKEQLDSRGIGTEFTPLNILKGGVLTTIGWERGRVRVMAEFNTRCDKDGFSKVVVRGFRKSDSRHFWKRKVRTFNWKGIVEAIDEVEELIKGRLACL